VSIKLKLLIQTLIPVICVTLLGAVTALWITISEHNKSARKNLTENMGQLKHELDELAAGVRQALDSSVQDRELITTARSLHLLKEGNSTLEQDLQCQVMQQLQRRLQALNFDLVALFGAKGLQGHATPAQYSITGRDEETGLPVYLTPTADSSLVDCPTKKWRESPTLAPLSADIDIPEKTTARFVSYNDELYVEALAPIKLLLFSMETFAEKEVIIGGLMFRKRVSEDFVAAFARKASKDVLVLTPSGEMVAGSGDFAIDGNMGVVRSAVSEGDFLTDYKVRNKTYYLMLTPYLYSGETVAVLATRTSKDVVAKETKRIIFLQLGGLVVGLMISIVIAFASGRLIAGPISLISSQMKHIANTRDFDKRVTVTSRDEIGELSKSFNEMTSHLKDAYGDLEAYKQHLEDLVEERTSELHRSMRELEAANVRIMESIHYARTIQQSILPTQASIAAHVPDYFVIWRPKDVIGGDLFWFDGHGGGFLFAVIDCTGHGVPGAIMTMISCTTLSRVVNEVGCTDPAKVLGQLNRLVQGALSRQSEQPLADDGLDIGICYVDASRTTLTFAGARISLFYSRNGDVHEIKGDRHSAGYRSSDPDYCFTNHYVEIDSSMRFYMATDGVHDQIGGERNLPFGKKRFKRLLIEHHTKPFSRQRELLLEAFMEYKGEDVQRDDVTVVGFTI
jgi:serine phosphatase RsbU (regulator of sigma subunit)